MSFQITENMPIVRAKFRIGPESLIAMQAYFDKSLEPWPQAVPKEVEVAALIDTGASVTILDHQLIQRMRHQPRGYCNISGFDSKSSDQADATSYPNYEMGLTLLGATDDDCILDVEAAQIVGHDIPNKNFSAIIGMDVLAHCNFQLDGPNQCFDLSSPYAKIKEIRSVKANS